MPVRLMLRNNQIADVEHRRLISALALVRATQKGVRAFAHRRFAHRSFAHQDCALVGHLLTSGEVGCCGWEMFNRWVSLYGSGCGVVWGD